ncbi:uncharacterized protein LOC144208761 [Stigmatopora nigra]
MLSHAQNGRMDDQRCTLRQSKSTPSSPSRRPKEAPSGPEADALFRMLDQSQNRRLDDQRVCLPCLPGIGGTPESGKRHQGQGKAKIPVGAPQITVNKGTPSKKQGVQATAPLDCNLSKSASFNCETEYQRTNDSTAQMTVKVSLSFTPQMGHKHLNGPCTFPEVFLTLGAPGENLMIPLSPRPGRPVSWNLNLVPKEDDDSPRRSRPSSPQPKTARKPQCGNSPRRAGLAITPEDDCFSLIEKVHATRLQGGHKQKGAKKDRKDGGNKH